MQNALTIKSHQSPETRFSEKIRTVKMYPPVRKLPIIRRINQASNAPADNIPLHEWKMPAQPGGYIKSRGFDFL